MLDIDGGVVVVGPLGVQYMWCYWWLFLLQWWWFRWRFIICTCMTAISSSSVYRHQSLSYDPMSVSLLLFQNLTLAPLSSPYGSMVWSPSHYDLFLRIFCHCCSILPVLFVPIGSSLNHLIISLYGHEICTDMCFRGIVAYCIGISYAVSYVLTCLTRLCASWFAPCIISLLTWVISGWFAKWYDTNTS